MHDSFSDSNDPKKGSVPSANNEQADSRDSILARAAASHAEHDLASAAEMYTSVTYAFPLEDKAWDGMGILLFQQVQYREIESTEQCNPS